MSRGPDQRSAERQSEERFVRSADPSLTPEANRLLSDELRAVLGRDRVRVPVDAPRREDDAHGRFAPALANLVSSRQIVLVSLLVALVVGAIATLATGSWWGLVGALAVHAVATLLAATGAIRLSTQLEHVSPTVAAKLEEEGVADPDAVFGDLVETYAGGGPGAPTAQTLSGGDDDRQAARPADDPAGAAVEQRTTMTPSSEVTDPAGAGAGAGPGAGRGPTRGRLTVLAAAVVVGVVAFMVLMGVVAGLI